MKKFLFSIFMTFSLIPVFGSVNFAVTGLDDSGKNAVELVQAELA
jgi:hypothetical protein